MRHRVKELDLISVPLPAQTDTYMPLSNKDAIETVRKLIRENGYTIQNESFSMNKTGQIATGLHTINMEADGIGMQVGWLNSYDKSRRFQIGTGGKVFVCDNGMFISTFEQLRKHTLNIHNDKEELITSVIKLAEQELGHLTRAKKNFEMVRLSKDALNEILGSMYFELDLVNSEQANILKREITSSKNFAMVSDESMTMWNLYNNITESLKQTHPSDYFDAHINAFNFVKAKTIELYEKSREGAAV